jgi:hypothetical protein
MMALGITGVFAPGVRSEDAAGNWYVAQTGSDSQDCTSPSTACRTINGAILKVNSGDTIFIDASTYTSPKYEQVINVTNNLTLSGGWNEDFSQQTGYTIIDGEHARRGLVIEPNLSVYADRLIIQNGYFSSKSGIYNKGNLTLDHCVVRDNSNGGISNEGNLVIKNSSISNNFAYSGGGIINIGFLSIVNSTISGNRADHYGGGLDNRNPDYNFLVSLKNTTIVGNSANNGGGIYSMGPLTIENSILANNFNSIGQYSPNCSGGVSSLGYNLFGIIGYPCSIKPAGTDLVNIDPVIGALIGRPAYLPLLSISPAINAGNPAGCTDELGNPLLFDQRDAARDARCDIGAYEYTIPGILASVEPYTGSPQTAKAHTRFPLPFQVLLLDQIGSPIGDTQVTFTAPVSGPTGIFSDTNTTVSNAISTETGIATSSVFTANEIGGSYLVEANVAGLPLPVQFSLTNIAQLYLPLNLKPCPMLYADNFTDPASGWHVGDDGNFLYEYLAGEYRILVRPDRSGALTRPGFQGSEYVVSVDLRNSSGVNGSYGIAFGVNQDWSYFNTFELYPDGYYGIYRFTPSAAFAVAEGFSPAIIQGSATNHIKLVYKDRTIRAYVNSQSVAYVTEMDYGSGYLGLAVFSYDTPNVDIRFDNFTVYPGNCDPTASLSTYSTGGQVLPGLELPAFEIIDRDHPRH